MQKTQVKFVRFERSRHNGKLAPVFEMYAPAGYVMAEFTGSHQYRSTGAGFKAVKRIMAVVEQTGKFPNVCAWF